uniref:Lcl C-terminal domain-containing protein n=1 Tax=Microvirgula aerodenitrificans TaxID=57480 RepID=UPI00248EA244
MSIFKYLLPGVLALGAALPAMARGDDGLRFVPQTGGRTGEVACVLDRRTGLLWERKTRSGLRARDHVYLPVDGRRGGEAGRCDAALPRCDAPSYVAAVNAARLCGHDDWRLPDENELKTLLDLSRVATRSSRPAIDRRAFPDALPTFYWSSTLHRVGGVRAVWFDDTHRELPATSLLPTRAGAVRLVRGQPAVVAAPPGRPAGAGRAAPGAPGGGGRGPGGAARGA